jgi:hypothetical protein
MLISSLPTLTAPTARFSFSRHPPACCPEAYATFSRQGVRDALRKPHVDGDPSCGRVKLRTRVLGSVSSKSENFAGVPLIKVSSHRSSDDGNASEDATTIYHTDREPVTNGGTMVAVIISYKLVGLAKGRRDYAKSDRIGLALNIDIHRVG